jgi:hypothetical protein
MTESVLVMIPLLITFLSVLQISSGVLARTVSSNIVQGAVATEAINSSMGTAASSSKLTSEATPRSALSTRQFELPGGGTFTIGTESINNPAVTPLLPGGDNYEATGLSITE